MSAMTRYDRTINASSRTRRVLRDAVSAIGIGAGAAVALTLILAAPASAAGPAGSPTDTIAAGAGDAPLLVSCTLVSMPSVPICDGSVR